MSGTKISPARRAVLERRAAAARRRALLTFTLFLLTVVVGVIAATTALSWWIVCIPAALMGTVLGLGRKAVVANQKNDAAYAARQETVTYAPRQMSATERKLAGRPVPAVRTGIPTAQAENISTTVMARVESSMFAKKHITGTAVSPNATPASAPQEPVARTQSASEARPQTRTKQETAQPAVAEKTATKKPVPAPPAATAGGQWSSVSVPAPVYTTKAAAPKWEAPGVTTELRQVTQARMDEIAREAQSREAAIAQRSASLSQQDAGTSHQGAGIGQQTEQHETEVAAAIATGGDALDIVAENATPDSLGVNLNSILARRRAV